MVKHHFFSLATWRHFPSAALTALRTIKFHGGAPKQMQGKTPLHAMHRLLFHVFRPPLLAALALLVTAADCRSATPGHAFKPGMPVTIAIETSGEFLRGESCELTVIATALIDSDDFSLDVQVPREMTLYSGDLHQRGPVRANTRFRLGLVVRVPTEGNPVITATARLRAGEAGAFEATATRGIAEPGTAATAARRGTLTGRNGERVREFPIP